MLGCLFWVIILARMWELGKVLMSLDQAREVARNMWEIQGLTMSQIAKVMGKSLGAIEKWGRVMDWMKKSDLKENVGAEVRELTRKKFLDQLAEAGLPSERITELFVEGLTTPMQGEIVELDSKTKKYKVAHPGTPDHKTRHKYHHDYMIAAGLIGNGTEQARGPGQGGSINIQVNIPEKR